MLLPFVSTRFQVLFHSLLKGSFHLSLTVLFTIGHKGVFRLGVWSPQIHAKFRLFRATQDTANYFSISFTGLSPSMASFPKDFYYKAVTVMQSYNPNVLIHWFGLFPFRSPLLRESHSISFPLGTEMFHFPRLASFRIMGHDSHWVSPFRNSRIKAHFQLPETYRR